MTYNGVGAPGPVADYALLRAAEVTTENGYDWFEVTQRWIDGRPDGAGGVRPSVSVGAGTGRYGGWSSSGVGVGLGLGEGSGVASAAGVGVGAALACSS